MLSKRKKVDEELRAFKEEWENNFFFVNHLERSTCVICNKSITSQHKHFSVIFSPDLVEALFMARSQLLSAILTRQHQKVANPWSRSCDEIARDPFVLGPIFPRSICPRTHLSVTHFFITHLLDKKTTSCMPKTAVLEHNIVS